MPSGRIIIRPNISTLPSRRPDPSFTQVEGAIAHSVLRRLVKQLRRVLTLSSRPGKICTIPDLIRECRNEIVSSKTKWESLKTRTLQSKLGPIA